MVMLAFLLYACVHACKQVLPVLAQTGTYTMCQKAPMTQDSKTRLLNILCNHLQLHGKANGWYTPTGASNVCND